jgi:hypothetical protein
MPRTNAIIAPVVSISPSVTRKGVEMIREAAPGGFSIEFGGKQTARLLPEERNAWMLEILEALRKSGNPVYVEVHPDTQAVTRILLPLVSRIDRISEGKEGDIRVAMRMPSVVYSLPRGNPDFDELLRTLRAAYQGRAFMIVTDNGRHEIIDVRPFPEEFKKFYSGGPFPPDLTQRLPPLQNLLDQIMNRIGDILRSLNFFRWLNAITEDKANEMFALVNGSSCSPLTCDPVGSWPCIPFLFPDGGCAYRAHGMYRLMKNAGVPSGKIWLFAEDANYFAVQTPNFPPSACCVEWPQHVASTVCVRGSFPFTTTRVIDPSLFGGPASVSTWIGKMTNQNIQPLYTAGSVTDGQTATDDESTWSWTDDPSWGLPFWGLQLYNRSHGSDGPPPYANCPQM